MSDTLSPSAAVEKAYIERIYTMLSGQRFFDWHQSGAFLHHISGYEPKVTKEQILNDIKSMMGLKN